MMSLSTGVSGPGLSKISVGPAGIISAVLPYYKNFMPRSGSRDVDSFLLAAWLAEVFGGMPAQVENAAEISLEHKLALRAAPPGPPSYQQSYPLRD